MKLSNLKRLYLNTKLIENENVSLNDELMHYVKNVLRLRIGDRFRSFNESDGEFIAKVYEVHKKSLVVNILELLRKPQISQKLSIGISIIRPDKMCDAINMAVQLGVTHITPLVADRSQSRTVNSEKLRKIIIEATEQSERLIPPKLTDSISIADFVKSNSSEIIIYANEKAPLQNSLSRINIKLSSVNLLIGPEGGFSTEEFEILTNSDAYSISLGSNILRAETAVAAVLAQVQLLRNYDA